MFFSGNDDVWNIIFVAVLIWCSYSTVRLIMKVSKGLMLQRNAKHSNEVVIRGTSVIYKTTNYIFAIVYEVFIIGIFLSFLIRYTFDFLLNTFLCIDIFLLCIQVIIHFVGIFKEKYVYQTNKGVIFYMGIFDFLECRFVWETTSSPEQLSRTLHIYKPNEKTPFTVTFDRQIETAHRIIEKHS